MENSKKFVEVFGNEWVLMMWTPRAEYSGGLTDKPLSSLLQAMDIHMGVQGCGGVLKRGKSFGDIQSYRCQACNHAVRIRNLSDKDYNV